MELLQCLEPLLACGQSVSGVFAKMLLLVAGVIGTARMLFKPLQPFITPLLDVGPMKKIQWDNKVWAFIAWFLDYTASIKVLQKK